MRAFRKTDVVVGKSIYLRAATKADAAFVFELRSHSFKSTYLHKIHGTVKDQEAWLEKSYADPHQFYFTINSAAHERLGLVRIYDQQGDSFCWGSWLIKDGAPASTAIESACPIVLKEFLLPDLKRLLFGGIDGDTTPFTQGSVKAELSSKDQNDWQTISIARDLQPGVQNIKVGMLNPNCDIGAFNNSFL